jgi:hypothetical protein
LRLAAASDRLAIQEANYRASPIIQPTMVAAVNSEMLSFGERGRGNLFMKLIS